MVTVISALCITFGISKTLWPITGSFYHCADCFIYLPTRWTFGITQLQRLNQNVQPCAAFITLHLFPLAFGQCSITVRRRIRHFVTERNTSVNSTTVCPICKTDWTRVRQWSLWYQRYTQRSASPKLFDWSYAPFVIVQNVSFVCQREWTFDITQLHCAKQNFQSCDTFITPTCLAS